MWGRAIRYAEVTSTNDLARDQARRGAREGTAVVAGYQLAGRGRRGKAWTAPAGTSLLVTYILRPPAHLTHSAWLALAAGAAMAQAVAEATGLEPALKWPNDVLLGARKVGGVLVETVLCGDSYAVLVGCGLNVGQAPGDFGEELAETATSLNTAAEREFAPDDLLPVLTQALRTLYQRLLRDGPGPVRDAWRSRDVTLGHAVRVDGPEGSWLGQAEDLDQHGGLTIRLEDGSKRQVTAGEVSLRLEE